MIEISVDRTSTNINISEYNSIENIKIKIREYNVIHCF